MSHDIESGQKRITAQKLAQLIEQLPTGSFVEVNNVGNLLVSDAAQNSLGYVDFAEESFEPFLA